MVVFVSDRDKANPGEIYSLAPGGAPLDVSRSLAPDYGLAVAPVGDLIAFWSGRSGRDGVYLARSDGSHLRLVRGLGPGIPAGYAGEGGPLQFSADGSRLFASYAVFHLPSTNTPYAFVIDTRTALARQIHGCLGARPSPDGGLVACGGPRKTSVYDLAGHLRFSLAGTNPLWSRRGLLTSTPGAGTAAPTRIVDSSGSSRATINGMPVAWSPDGRWLAFSHGQDLWVAGPDNFAHARLLLANWGGALAFTPDSRFISTQAQPAGAVLMPLAGGRAVKGLDGGLGAWSRDGRLAFVGYPTHFPIKPGFAMPVYVTDTHGAHPRLAGRFAYDDHAVAELHWLPDGKRVLYLTSNSCGANGLYAVSAAGGPTRRLTRDPRNLGTPAWSPDGTRLAYSVTDFACHLDAGRPIHLETMAANGTGIETLTDENDFDANPSYSPDGRRVAFSHSTFDSGGMQIVDVGGSTRRPLPPAAEGAPAWSPDGSRIAYLAGREIMAIAPTGGTPEAIATDLPKPGCGSGGIAWSPDGKQLAVGGGAGIYLVTVGQPASVRLAIRTRCAEYPSFSPDGTQIAFDAAPAHPLGGQSAIMVANVDGTDIRVLSTVPFRQSLHPTWQPSP
jgi:Tol biopolymer transport system component